MLAAYLGARHATCAFKVHHLTVSFEVVELSAPVASHGEDIYIKAFDVVNLLTLIFFDDNFVSQACGAHGLYTLHERLLHVNLSTLAVERVGGDAHDEVVAQCLCTFQ